MNQVKQLENQIIQLQPIIINMESNQVALSAKQKMLQSMALIQALLLYINIILVLALVYACFLLKNALGLLLILL